MPVVRVFIGDTHTMALANGILKAHPIPCGLCRRQPGPTGDSPTSRKLHGGEDPTADDDIWEASYGRAGGVWAGLAGRDWDGERTRR
ncbi:hypothetical protein GCM10009067_30360 [Haloarcula sebkhae]|uniref:Uncharacterized protein n=1 Tax=Haloarcula sebkhae TaxID=932660 RepID=A0A830ETV7_9EURY|nr:hypothetical protein GCM10009067_30360 [Haloarcula sebkhae]